MSNFTAIKKEFHKLSSKEQEALLRDMYTFSKDTRLFLEGKLLEGDTVAREFIREMERETIDKIYHRSTPVTPNGRVINSIISKARKASASVHTLMEHLNNSHTVDL